MATVRPRLQVGTSRARRAGCWPGLRRPFLRRRLGDRLRRRCVGLRCGRCRLGLFRRCLPPLRPLAGGACLFATAGDLRVELREHVGGLGLHHRQQLEPRGFELGELAAFGLALLGRPAERIDLDDEVFGLGVELPRAVIARGAERLLLVPPLLVLELLDLGLSFGSASALKARSWTPDLSTAAPSFRPCRALPPPARGPAARPGGLRTDRPIGRSFLRDSASKSVAQAQSNKAMRQIIDC